MKASLTFIALSLLFSFGLRIHADNKPKLLRTHLKRQQTKVLMNARCDSVVRLSNDLIGAYRNGTLHIEKIEII